MCPFVTKRPSSSSSSSWSQPDDELFQSRHKPDGGWLSSPCRKCHCDDPSPRPSLPFLQVQVDQKIRKKKIGNRWRAPNRPHICCLETFFFFRGWKKKLNRSWPRPQYPRLLHARAEESSLCPASSPSFVCALRYLVINGGARRNCGGGGRRCRCHRSSIRPSIHRGCE